MSGNGIARFWNGDTFHGTYVVYAAAEGEMLPIICDVEIDSLVESDLSELRGNRRRLKKKGKRVPKLRHDTLHNELVVLFGPKMSAKQAVETLEMLARKIETNGLLAGRRLPSDYFLRETVEGDLI